jgi:hypothetical protein
MIQVFCARILSAKNTLLLGILATLLLAAATPAGACPFCSPSESDLFSQVTEAQVVCLVERVDAKKYRIGKPLKGKAPQGKIVIAADPIEGIPADAPYLLLSTATSPNLPYWSDPAVALKESELAFVKEALRLGGSDSKKLNFAADHLGSSSPKISQAAYNILASATMEELQRAGARVGQEQLVAWAQNPKLSEQRRALFVVMALPGLGKQDQKWLKDALFSPPKNAYSPLLGPLIMAYNQATGPSGIEEVEQVFLKPSLSASSSYQALASLMLIGQTSPSKLTRDRARDIFVRELRNPKRKTLAIGPLAVWGNYSVAETIERMAVDNDDLSGVRIAAIRYFRTFKTPAAAAALERLKKLDPELVKKTTQPYKAADVFRF